MRHNEGKKPEIIDYFDNTLRKTAEHISHGKLGTIMEEDMESHGKSWNLKSFKEYEPCHDKKKVKIQNAFQKSALQG